MDMLLALARLTLEGARAGRGGGREGEIVTGEGRGGSGGARFDIEPGKTGVDWVGFKFCCGAVEDCEEVDGVTSFRELSSDCDGPS